MILVLTSKNPKIAQQLRSPRFRPLGVDERQAETGREALEMIRKERPALAILDARIDGMDGYEVCRQVKTDSRLQAVRVILVVSERLDASAAARLGESGCDDVLMLPAPSDELYQHVARLVGLPHRTNRRARVELALELEVQPGARALEGRVLDLSLTGARVALRRSPGANANVRVHLEGGVESARTGAVHGRVVWELPADAGEGAIVGIQFVDLTTEARRWLAELCQWEIAAGDDGRLLVTLLGDLTEVSDLRGLARRLEGTVEFDLAGLRYLNSAGVRLWSGFLAGLARVDAYSFVRASTGFITQAAMVRAVLGRGQVLSFFAPYQCETCDRSEERLLQPETVRVDGQLVPPRFRCGTCYGPLKFDDLPERFFGFLQR
jgi:CheY-like chemotaxis protein